MGGRTWWWSPAKGPKKTWALGGWCRAAAMGHPVVAGAELAHAGLMGGLQVAASQQHSIALHVALGGLTRDQTASGLLGWAGLVHTCGRGSPRTKNAVWASLFALRMKDTLSSKTTTTTKLRIYFRILKYGSHILIHTIYID
jgi:hypothetical protein